MQRGGQAARTGRRVISQKWGFFGKGPLDVSVLVGWRGVGMGWVGRCSTAGTYPVRTSARPFHPFHCYPLATVLPPPPLCRSVTVQCPTPRSWPKGPAIIASQTCSSRGEASGRVTSLISIQEHQEGTPTILSILSRKLLTLAISRADSSCIMQRMALTSHGLHVISKSGQSLQHGTPPLAAPVGAVVRSFLYFSVQKK